LGLGSKMPPLAPLATTPPPKKSPCYFLFPTVSIQKQ